MVDKDLLAAKLTELAERVARVRKHVPPGPETLRDDRDMLDLVAFNLMLSVQTCTDIASHIIADEGWPAARSLGEGFLRLEEHGAISSKTAAALRNAIGLRNVVAHGYAGLDIDRCFRGATEGVNDLDAFAREVSSWAASQ
ncbi:MAG TPA: DUF86 domain-containing protein [Polyangiaceae bacterium]|jgi:uncharacterized protein YutE (UPF0331/DUF86 family)